MLATACAALACEPKLVVGERLCPLSDAASSTLATAPVLVGWQTGFENDFCDFAEAGGYCVEDARASNAIVSSPAPHGGQFAASFTVDLTDGAGFQSRCVRQGALPLAAYYGAWFYFPKRVDNPRSWNLFHFRGGDLSKVDNAQVGEAQAGPDVHSLWDVSVQNASNGALQVFVFEFSTMATYVPPNAPTVPIGKWFHVQFYFKRARDKTGEVRLYQDGKLLFQLTDWITDDTDWGRWYVGDYSKGIEPPDSTVYVDDVSIEDSL